MVFGTLQRGGGALLSSTRYAHFSSGCAHDLFTDPILPLLSAPLFVCVVVFLFVCLFVCFECVFFVVVVVVCFFWFFLGGLFCFADDTQFRKSFGGGFFPRVRGLVHVDFSELGEFTVGPDSFCQLGKCCGSFPGEPVDLGLGGEAVGYC